MSAGHTPTPWTACEHPEGRAGIRASDGKMVARCEGMFGRQHVSPSEWVDNARFICRAVNAHDELVEAAQRVLDGLNARILSADPCSVPVFDGIADLQTALSKALGNDGGEG